MTTKRRSETFFCITIARCPNQLRRNFFINIFFMFKSGRPWMQRSLVKPAKRKGIRAKWSNTPKFPKARRLQLTTSGYYFPLKNVAPFHCHQPFPRGCLSANLKKKRARPQRQLITTKKIPKRFQHHHFTLPKLISKQFLNICLKFIYDNR